MIKNKKSQAGFTLVELSIVLVIIGLIIGGVLTGRQILQNAEVTNALNSIQAYQAQFQTYVQNYGVLPGDDATATTRFSSAGLTNNGNGDGTIQGSFDSATVTDESRLVWADLRAAGLVKGTAVTEQPTNPFNGIVGFQHGVFSNAFTGNVLCLNNVPAAAAEALDARLDDGNSNTGTIRSMVDGGTVGAATGGAVAASYAAGQTFILCISM